MVLLITEPSLTVDNLIPIPTSDLTETHSNGLTVTKMVLEMPTKLNGGEQKTSFVVLLCSTVTSKSMMLIKVVLVTATSSLLALVFPLDSRPLEMYSCLKYATIPRLVSSLSKFTSRVSPQS